MDTLNVDMDGYKIGPAGQTLGELKGDVRRARMAYVGALLNGGDAAPLLEPYETAQNILKAAYVRMGLPYEVP